MGTITIVGLGPGAVGHLSLETMGLLQNCAQVILRTAVHPTVAELEKQNVKFTSCDDLYEKAASFEEVYNSVVERVLAAAQNGDVVYAVPGSPLVAEKTVVLMRTAAKAQGVKLVIKPSMSFLDLAYVELGIDPIAGLQIIDAQDFAEIASAGQHPLMITQVYSQMVAGDLKIALMDVLPDEYEIYFLRNLGLPDEECRPIKLFELDRQPNIDHLTSAYVPPMTWASKNQPEQPQQLSVITTDNKVSVSWSNPSNYTDGTKIATPYIYNNVYASKKYPVDITDARNLVAARIMGNSFKIENSDAKHLFVAVTSMDGYGIESQPTQEKEEENPLFAKSTGAAKLLECDGKKVYLAETTKNLVFDVLMVETLQGCDILYLHAKDNTLDVRNLKEGIYRVVSINKKGYRHTLGTFKMKKN